MKPYFRPLPSLTIVTGVALIILILLGSWQYQRLQWKTQLLSDIDIASEAKPFTSLSQVTHALEAGEPIDFRRFGSTVSPVFIETPFLVFSAENRDISWRVFQPVQQQGRTVFAGLNLIADKDRETVNAQSDDSFPIAGYIRLARDNHRGMTKSTPELNRWFGFNPLPDTHNWADDVYGTVDVRFYIDSVTDQSQADMLAPRKPNIRNNHFDYMLTWYGLAIVLLVIYLIFHHRAGRLGLFQK